MALTSIMEVNSTSIMDVNSTVPPVTSMTLSEDVNASLVSLSNRALRPDIWYWRVGLFGVGGIIIEIFGIICNITAIVVLAHFRNKSSAPFLLMCLAVFDILYLFFNMVLENVTLLSAGGLIDRRSYRAFITPIYCYAFPLAGIAQTCVVYTVVVITLERYTVVSSPFKAHTLCSLKAARIAVLSVLGLAILYHIPNYMSFTCNFRWDNRTQSNRTVFERTEFGFTDFYNKTYTQWINLTFNFLIPFAILLTFNVLLIKALNQSREGVNGAQNRTQNEHRLTFMVFCMTAIFFLCELLAALSIMLTAGLQNYTQSSRDINRFAAVADTFILINSAINFAIYCATGRKFRDTFCQVFCRCHVTRRNKTVSAANANSRQNMETLLKTRSTELFSNKRSGCYSINSTSSGGSISSANRFSKIHSVSGETTRLTRECSS